MHLLFKQCLHICIYIYILGQRRQKNRRNRKINEKQIEPECFSCALQWVRFTHSQICKCELNECKNNFAFIAFQNVESLKTESQETIASFSAETGCVIVMKRYYFPNHLPNFECKMKIRIKFTSSSLRQKIKSVPRVEWDDREKCSEWRHHHMAWSVDLSFCETRSHCG